MENPQQQNTIQQAESCKEKGNTALKANDFDKAVDFYTQAIDSEKGDQKFPKQKLAVYYSNRSFANIKLENYRLAILDADEAIKLNPNYEKAYLRLAFCSEITQKYKQAYAGYKKAFELTGNKDESIYSKLANCKKMSDQHIKNRKLELLHDDKERGPKKAQPYKNWREIEIEKEYTGPMLKDDQQVTSSWVVKLMEYYKDQKSLHKRVTLQLIEKCKDIVSKYKSLVDYEIGDQEEITVCGDIHGQYYDVLNIFKINGNPGEKNNYLFNGDFVDRGSFSVECIMTLIAWKCVNPNYLHMTRGNHEAKQVNMVYGFKGQVQAKFKDNGVYEAFSEFFCALPLTYVINKKVMICHGGLPVKDDVTLQEIRSIDRFKEAPESGIMCDLLWADPIDTNGRQPSKRGVSMGFGPDISEKFLKQNNLERLVRSHEVKQGGYEQAHDGRVITIFSAPNYCDFTGNQAAFIRFKGNEMKPKYTQFQAVPHPNIGPMAYANQFRGLM